MGAFGHEGKLAKEGGVQEIEASGGMGAGESTRVLIINVISAVWTQ